jgi:hypothetical protein
MRSAWPLQRPRLDSRSSHDALLLAAKYLAAQLQVNDLQLFSSANRPFRAPRTGADDGVTTPGVIGLAYSGAEMVCPRAGTRALAGVDLLLY